MEYLQIVLILVFLYPALIKPDKFHGLFPLILYLETEQGIIRIISEEQKLFHKLPTNTWK